MATDVEREEDYRQAHKEAVMFGLDFDPYEDDEDEVMVTSTKAARRIDIDLMPDQKKGQLYNMLSEHVDGEHVDVLEGCPRCEGDDELADKVSAAWGLTA